MADIQILSTNAREILIDSADLELVSQYPWTVSQDGYAKKYFEHWNGGKNRQRWVVHMHRLIMDADSGQVVDHINQNTLDNRRCNLRFASKSLNAHNSRKIKGAVPYRGVMYNHQKGKPYQANITINGRRKRLGLFDTAEEASKTYLTKQEELTR